ncbi:putative endonuclease I [Rosa chinensis]|uniref:Putative endonuclease I n=1 Tax=Rosa chinensis TaxID=74649 RepID=A0A2P6QSA5_ROSCH|nr:extracellular ribonuclease isoform X2 [Rosa chinensis]PRQ37072.1 putative endonuclease I [Rosa chinensis]
MQSSPVMATKFHCAKPVVVCKQRPNFFRGPENFKLKPFNRNPDHILVSPITSTISTRGIWDFTKCINISWRWVSQILSVYLLFLNIVADAQAYDYPSPSSSSSVYACEDVNNYYANVEHLEGKSLKKKLNSIIGKHQSLSYREVWNALKILDASDVDNPEASSGIVEIYSVKVVPKSLAGKPEGWNREHLWPRSYGLKNGPSLTDIHNIRPADVNVNSSRGNKYYGECSVNSAKCLKPASKEAALDTETDKDRWAPPKQHRGDIARALMYMAVCYGYRQTDGGPVLHLSDSPKISKSEMGLLSTLLKWNEIDPPSREEKLRNDRVCKFYQHNRNPFVDHPEYATLIWKEHILSHHAFHPLPRSHQIQNNKQGNFSKQVIR